jgi:asparagine synthetase B (glutamine-hydrolysing)
MQETIQNNEEWAKHISRLKKVSLKTNKIKVKNALLSAIERNIPDTKFGILFSGGVDSTFIAYVCKKLKRDFTCYSVGLKDSEDLIEAKKVAKKLGLRLKAKTIRLTDAERIIKKVTLLLGEPDVMKVGVASVIYAGLELASKDKISDFFTGLGSEEIFAGYERHKLAKDINAECWNGLYTMFKRDILRDNAVANQFKVKLLVPFLDKEVIINAMNLPGKVKIVKGENKFILRQIAIDMGLKKDFAMRKKRAAQYGSKMDKAIMKLAKMKGFVYKKDYLIDILI